MTWPPACSLNCCSVTPSAPNTFMLACATFCAIFITWARSSGEASSRLRTPFLGTTNVCPGARGHIGPLVLQIVGDRAAERGVGDIMRGMGGDRAVAARDLVGALRARLDHLQALLDRVLDRLIVADLEMQERPVLDRAPIAAIDRLAAEE